MEKMFALRSLYRSLSFRSYHFIAPAVTNRFTTPTVSHISSYHHIPLPSECRSSVSTSLGSMRFYSEDVSHKPDINDPQLLNAFKDLIAESWDEIPDSVVYDVKEALSKNTEDKAGNEIVANVFRAAEAVEEFSGIITTLRMTIDDSVGMSGEDVKPLPDHIKNAIHTIFDRYSTYLNSFGPDETYLRKKVETELGTKLIHLKMRCSGLGAEWGKVTVLGTSGLAGSYVEQRA
ncbi:PREDICTED: succinate dehydrogenase subunit 5, mitochondrial-like [Lupinus angustifolius]|nr:PREDICTED: succinate dehydrogenase subunit 5, mitochondrial-like [Lupinus angustifolius]XP_019458926.1 PREDICTED: succinate dehydrogenase subunit 5, mitochondrial-like [Lupinus angustifolius]